MRSETDFVRNFLLPQLAVVGIAVVALFGMFASAITQQNHSARQKEISQIETGMNNHVNFVSKNLRDYARWDDAVDNLVKRLDVNWANENLGPYLYAVQGYQHTFVIDAKGNTLYASHENKQVDLKAMDALPSLPSMLARLNRAKDGVEERVANLADMSDGPAIVAASAILPSFNTEKIRGYDRRYLIIVYHVDNQVLSQMSSTYKTAKIEMTVQPVGVARKRNTIAEVPLMDGQGKAIGYINWQVSRPGDEMRDRTLPVIVLVVLLIFLLAVLVLRIARRTTRDLEASEGAARHLANHDMLTGLPNRRAQRARGILMSGEKKAVLYLDLDGFKEVNDLFGHQAGDALLKEASGRLRTVLDDKGMLARVGGDEFSILITGSDAHAIALEIAPRIVKTLGEPFRANHIKMVVSASVGIALGDEDSEIDDLARYADIAMYSAKESGKNRWRIYDPEMCEGREVRKILESELRDAIKNQEIEVVYQPIVDARTHQVTCVEALARWTSPTQGSVGPAIFVPIAEETGLIVDLGDQVLRKACMAARDWPVGLAVNLSPAQFWHRGLVSDVARILQDCEFPADRLELEITEGYLISRPEVATEIIGQLRSLGIRLALDDFGTGFASIGYLRRFELDRIKLDRSFVDSVECDQEAMMVAQAVITLSQALKLPITAEGVENVAQSHMLTIAGCERLQGWHYGRPGSQEDISKMLSGVPMHVPDRQHEVPELRQVG